MTYPSLLQTPMSASSRSSSSSMSLSSSSSRLSTSSSLSSTFSDVSYSSLALIPSPSVSPPPADKASKTHSFFASPFSQGMPSSGKPQDEADIAQPAPKRSLTASFFAPKPPPDGQISILPPTDLSTSKPRIPLSRFFPSRYNSDPSELSLEEAVNDNDDTPQPIANASLTTSFFATASPTAIPISIIPPTASLTGTDLKSKPHIPLSRLFPSRYSSDPAELDWSIHDDNRHYAHLDNQPHHSSDNRREFLILDTDSPHLHGLTRSPTCSSPTSLSPVTPSSPLSRPGWGEDEAASQDSTRHHEAQHQVTVGSEPETQRTPRPSDSEPPVSFLQFGRPPRLASQLYLQPADPLAKDPEHKPNGASPPHLHLSNGSASDQDHDEESVLGSGSVIRSPSLDNLPTPPSQYTHTIRSDPQPTVLRLISQLGQGAFSAVWLARDESDVPLVERARLRIGIERQSSLRRNGSGKGRGSLVLSRQNSIHLKRKGSRKHKKGASTGTDGDSILRRSNSATSLRSITSVKSIASVASAASSGSDNTSTTSSEEPSTNTTIGVSLGKGGVCGVRPWASVSAAAKAQAKEHEATSGSKNGRGVGLGLGVGLEIEPSREVVQEKVNLQRLVAVKVTSLPARRNNGDGAASGQEDQERERMRVSFVREVEVLKHISHPNITPLLTHMTTRTHHILVLPYLPGGDLLGLVNNNETHSSLGESVLRRMFIELCKAVAWMHSVGLVHRDIKLENILLTTSAFSILSSSTDTTPHANHAGQYFRPTLESLPTPLIQLTDFGLSRFIDPARPLLSTRCGSEAYAAPELVMGGGRASVASEPLVGVLDTSEDDKTVDGYDARETDAWACGVVLYALVCRRLPFGEGVGGLGAIGTIGASGIRGEHAPSGSPGGKAERRRWLMRIARGEYEWPEVPEDGDGTPKCDELVGAHLVKSEGARRVVEKLLVRDPSRRATIGALLGQDAWLQEPDAGEDDEMQTEGNTPLSSAGSEHRYLAVGGDQPNWHDGLEESCGRQEEETATGSIETLGDDEGVLVGEPSVDSIACREVV